MSESRFSKAGIDLNSMSEEQRTVLESLSPAEADTLISVKQRIDAAGDDVQGHAEGDGGVFW